MTELLRLPYRILIMKHLGRPRRRWEIKFHVDLREFGSGSCTLVVFSVSGIKPGGIVIKTARAKISAHPIG
jgi:hypothetical protein